MKLAREYNARQNPKSTFPARPSAIVSPTTKGPTPSVARVLASVAISAALTFAQSSPSTTNSSNANGLVDPAALPDVLSAALMAAGARMTTASNAQLMLAGTITDSNGTRSAQIVVQAPGYLSYSDQTKTLTFNGSMFQSSAGQLTSSDQRIIESLLAHLPDTVFLQIAAGGGMRSIGSHFRTDNGKTANYSGPFWTLLAFSPISRTGLTPGQPLQESMFLAVNEKTGFLDEVRLASPQSVTQTQFINWTQQTGQWVPTQIVRLENGQQVLSFQIQQASAGPATLSPSTFQP